MGKQGIFMANHSEIRKKFLCSTNTIQTPKQNNLISLL